MNVPATEVGRKYRGAAPGQRQQERRARLIEAGVELYGTEGYRNTTVVTVCARAGVGKRYFYESFTDSEDLLLEVYREVTGRILEAIHRGMGTEADGLDVRVRGAVTGYFRLIADDPRVPRIVFFEILGVSPVIDAAYRQVVETLVDVCVALAAPYLDVAAHPPARLRAIMTGLNGAMLMIAQQWVQSGYREPLDDVVDSAVLMVQAVLARVGS
ncbi:TetR/AcrR family transcriptional regulator [Nocardia thailandica]|uniref:TetR/AcrR family transcriptional regulator n=1 Tax=Nocardia thailandica TaxID=257275 RepID=UPI000319781B|nr:TetR/AcrR family transcriptional regulator [Nocardia thailandica]